MGQGLSCASVNHRENGVFGLAQSGNLDALKSEFEDDSSLLHQESLYDHQSLLHIAAANGQIHVLSWLLERTLHPDVLNRHKQIYREHSASRGCPGRIPRLYPRIAGMGRRPAAQRCIWVYSWFLLVQISGYALLTLIMEREICKNIPVIMMSTHDSVNMVYKCMLKGAADFLVKPIRINELKNLWQHVWRRQCLKRGLSPQDESVAQQKLEAIE